MANKKDLAADLAEKMLTVLHSQRGLGGVAYPLTLQRLVELADPLAPSELVDKALAKKPFKDRVIVAQKKNRAAPIALVEDLETLAASHLLLEFVLDQLCTPASPFWPPGKLKSKVETKLKKPLEEAVLRQIRENTLPPTVGCLLEKNKPLLYLRRIPLPPPPEEVLAGTMLQVLESQRRLGGDAYPLSLQRLVELSVLGKKTTAALVKKALTHPILQGKLLVVDAGTPEAPVALAEDRNQYVGSRVLLEFLLRTNRKPTNHTIAIDKLLKKGSDLAQPLQDSIQRQMDEGSLPATIGWMWIGKKKQLFFLEDIHRGQKAAERVAVPALAPIPPQPAPSREAATDFVSAFAAAFNQIDRHKGGHNFVNLVDLRREVPLPREAFDAELRKLRIAGLYTLSAAEGRHGISTEERAAGIVEDGSLLLYVSRRAP